MNPELTQSPSLHRVDAVGKSMVKFRVGSHNLPIEIGRWNRTPREERLCATCGVIGDENHVVYGCSMIDRNDLGGLPPTMSTIWEHKGVNRLFKRLLQEKLIEV